MRHTLNRKGLTFEEWVCAAGLAVIDQGLVQPYTYSYPVGPEVRRRITYYPLWVRKAWREGEDPTEYRAMGTTLNRRRANIG